MMRVETLGSTHELDRLKARWTRLEQQCEATLFQSYELNRRAACWFAARETPHVVVAESGSGMAIIPAVRRDGELGLIGETLFDYRDVLSAGDPQVLECAWRELARAGLPLEVTALRGEGVRERWQSLHPTPFCNAPATRRSDGTAAEFAAAHHKSAKASRRLARQGLRLTRRDGGLRRIAEWIYRRKAEWQGNSENLFLNRRRQNFMLWIVRSGILDCTIWSYETRSGDVAAALATFRHGSVRHFYTIHHDPRWERFSPGQTMIFDVTRETLAEGLDVDFMTGEYAYKNRLATAMIPLYRVAASAEQVASWKSAAPEAATPAA
jgi:CelD/BcsL family acetyltransferase involved in cellulose biosynthesis